MNLIGIKRFRNDYSLLKFNKFLLNFLVLSGI